MVKSYFLSVGLATGSLEVVFCLVAHLSFLLFAKGHEGPASALMRRRPYTTTTIPFLSPARAWPCRGAGA